MARLPGASVRPAPQHLQVNGKGEINPAIVDRDHDCKMLVVMVTGGDKTRTVSALCDLLMRSNWIERVLFLAERVALVNQAVNAFNRHLPDASSVNLVTERDAEGRILISTYPNAALGQTHRQQGQPVSQGCASAPHPVA